MADLSLFRNDLPYRSAFNLEERKGLLPYEFAHRKLVKISVDNTGLLFVFMFCMHICIPTRLSSFCAHVKSFRGGARTFFYPCKRDWQGSCWGN